MPIPKRSVHKDSQAFSAVMPSEGLRGHTARSHPQEAQQPVHDIENHHADGDGTDIGFIADMPDDRKVYKSQQRDRHIAYDGGYCKT